MWTRSKQKGWVRLLKQVEQAEFEWEEYGVERIRFKSYYDTVKEGIWWERPHRTVQRSWKSHRKNQYK